MRREGGVDSKSKRDWIEVNLHCPAADVASARATAAGISKKVGGESCQEGSAISSEAVQRERCRDKLKLAAAYVAQPILTRRTPSS